MLNGKQAISLMEQTAKYVQACGKRSILECKPQTFEHIKLSGLKLAPIGDTFVTETPKLTSQISPLCPAGMGWQGTAKTINGKIIGKYDCHIPKYDMRITSITDFPKSWIDSSTGLPKKSLYIAYMDTQFAEHQGYGREMMKRFYLQSLECGCEGRISLDSAWNSGGFYKKLGFEVPAEQLAEYKKLVDNARAELKLLERLNDGCQGNAWREEYKKHLLDDIEHYSKILANPFQTGNNRTQQLYFTPTPENVAKLFSK